MRRLRMWGLPVVRYLHLSGPDEMPGREPVMTGARDADPDGPPIEEPEPVIERLDVPPEIRDWDVAKDTAPAEHPPHCDGRHAGDARCEYCDALADTITALKRAEKRIGDLETAVSALIDDVGRLGREVHQ